MLLPVLLALALIGFGIYFLMLFFQFQKIENRLDDTLKNVEVFMLREFGEISPDSILKTQEEKKQSEKKGEDPKRRPSAGDTQA